MIIYLEIVYIFLSYCRKLITKFLFNIDFYRLATEALLEEAKAGAKRAAVMGPSGWIKKKESINKRFLSSTLRNAVKSNQYKYSCNKKENRSSEPKKTTDN